MLLTAKQIHNGHHWLPEYSVIETTEDGTILAIHAPGAQQGAVVYDGILCPGFVNAHCHLELSHMQGAVPEATGLIPFVQQIVQHRNKYTDEQKVTARHEAFAAMQRAGIVAVGDIANTADAADLRAQDAIHFHTFVESLGFTPARAEAALAFAEGVYSAYAAQPQAAKVLRQSIVPHAPYSVSKELFRLISAHNAESIISIHNQETAAENEFYEKGTGAVNHLLQSLGIDAATFTPYGNTSLRTYLQWLSQDHPLLLVHDIFTTAEEIKTAQQRPAPVFWCLCPQANWYIERRLPDVPMLAAATENICIGTDSLASNHQLSILSELQLLQQHFPQLRWETLLCWATYNGARALGMEGLVGSLTIGTQPGILQLQPAKNNGLTVKRIC